MILSNCAKTSKALNTLAKKSSKLFDTMPVLVEYVGLGDAEVTIVPDDPVAKGEV